MYFNIPAKPDGASKTYYMDELINCLKYTFLRAREESPFQSTDESMIKFKGRSSMKQRMPNKPIRDGIKALTRSDAESGDAYDLNLYGGKGENFTEGTLGESIVRALCKSIRGNDVEIFSDRFFTSVRLMKTLPFPCVGTVMANRKNLPQLTDKLARGDSQVHSKWGNLLQMERFERVYGPQ